MVKKYRGEETLLEPPSEGWGILWFADGYKAQVSGATDFVKEGKEYTQFYLMPFDALAKRYKIDMKKDLDRNLHCIKIYPRNMVFNLNKFDPSRRVFFSMLNWDGKPTDSTKWFEGVKQNKEIVKLRETLRTAQAENEKLKEENLFLKTNVQKYIKENIQGIILPMMPAIRSLLIDKEKSDGGSP